MDDFIIRRLIAVLNRLVSLGWVCVGLLGALVSIELGREYRYHTYKSASIFSKPAKDADYEAAKKENSDEILRLEKAINQGIPQ